LKACKITHQNANSTKNSARIEFHRDNMRFTNCGRCANYCGKVISVALSLRGKKERNFLLAEITAPHYGRLML
jgi:hypothetical protein